MSFSFSRVVTRLAIKSCVKANKHPTHTVDIQGIDNHQITAVPIVTTSGVIHTPHREVITIMHQYAYVGQGKTIHSSAQLESFKNDVNDKSMKVFGGLQCIKTNDGYVHPLDIKSGLHYISTRPLQIRKGKSFLM